MVAGAENTSLLAGNSFQERKAGVSGKGWGCDLLCPFASLVPRWGDRCASDIHWMNNFACSQLAARHRPPVCGATFPGVSF